MKYNVTNIQWDTDGIPNKSLPTSITLEVEDEDDVIDDLSDEYGFCIFSADIEEA